MTCEPSVENRVPTVVRTLRLKVKSEAYPWLNAAAIEVNYVWNYCNEISARAARPFAGPPRYLSRFDLDKLTAGATEYFEHIGAATIQRVNAEFATRRKQFKKAKLRWRISRGPRRSLGWVPYKVEQLKRQGKCLRFSGKSIRVFEQALRGARARGRVVTTDFSSSAGAAATRQLLNSKSPPTAIVYDNDIMAVAGLGTAQEMGVLVPAELSLVSFDDSTLCEVVRPALTARARDVLAYGARAAQALIALVEGEEMPGNVDEMPRLISRGSTAALVASAPGEGQDALPAH